MKVQLVSEERANGFYIVERWESGRTVDHGPMGASQVKAYGAKLEETIRLQAQVQHEQLAAMARPEAVADFFAKQETRQPWLLKRKARKY